MKKQLSVPDKHQLKIAKDTLKMSDSGALIMGGMTKAEALAITTKYLGTLKLVETGEDVKVYADENGLLTI